MKITYSLLIGDAGSKWGLFAFDESLDEGPCVDWGHMDDRLVMVTTSILVVSAPAPQGAP